ncbi:MAG TPA: STAS-like domain-containing protein [Solirubrobacteraceae bacterium]|nr:STAS-like domain-containing protein [Solirubrobacteraceae bacterium]
MTIRLASEFGAVLLGRTSAEGLRTRVERAARAGNQHVVLDFEGVITVSPSFADELFAKLDPAVRRSGHLEVRGMSDALASLARFVEAGRPSFGA